jgi:hypothetical protein
MNLAGEMKMKTHLMIAVCLIGALSCASGCNKAKNRLDVTLQGPWMLYQDSRFDDNGKKVAVLIAIAPRGVSDYTGGPGDDLHHQPPQITTGDGYFVKTSGIYCLTFDGKCAPKGPASLKHDGYTKPVPLTVNSHSSTDGPAAWDWVSASRGHIALILPMPDSYSNEGTWFMRFAPNFDPTGKSYQDVDGPRHSIGIQLHYASGPSKFNLLLCDGTPTSANCKKPPTDILHTQLDNTGTLNVLMKAPDNNDGCDRHVRFAYHEMAKLLNNSFNQGVAYIEPATGADSDGNAIYETGDDHPCFDKDPQKPSPAGGGANQMPAMSNTDPLDKQLGEIVTSLKCISSLLGEDQTKPSPLLFDEIEAASKGLDPDFPRISQLSRIEQLLRESANYTDSLTTQVRKKSRAPMPGEGKALLAEENTCDQGLQEALKKLQGKETRYLIAAPTKSGNDCLAPLMEVKE